MATEAEAADCLFREAQAAFLQSLGPSDKQLFAHCNNSGDLLDDVKRVLQFRAEHRNWNRAFEKIRTFSRCLEPYFTVIDIVISSHPEWTAIAWGAVRLVLQVLRIPVTFTEVSFG